MIKKQLISRIKKNGNFDRINLESSKSRIGLNPKLIKLEIISESVKQTIANHFLVFFSSFMPNSALRQPKILTKLGGNI